MQHKRVLKFYFIAEIKSVCLSLRFPCDISIVWKRGQQLREIRAPQKIQNGVCSFQERTKLQLQCKVVYNEKTQLFQQKKTKFVVIIYSTKGKKQAGELQFDLAQLLNSKNSSFEYTKKLNKCPDKNATLKFEVCAMLDGQLNFDACSGKPQQENRKLIRSQSLSDSVVIQQLDFKKKKIYHMEVISESNTFCMRQNITPFSLIYDPNMNQTTSTERSCLKISKAQEISKKENFLEVYQQNARLKQEVQNLQAIEIQNNKLRNEFRQKQLSHVAYYSIKMEQIQREVKQLRQQHQNLIQLQIMKSEKHAQIQRIKEKIGRIVNFSIQSGYQQIADEIFSVTLEHGSQD